MVSWDIEFHSQYGCQAKGIHKKQVRENGTKSYAQSNIERLSHYVNLLTHVRINIATPNPSVYRVPVLAAPWHEYARIGFRFGKVRGAEFLKV